ncbi:SgcJ/EcaC family oxidoreductase [Streptomyces sp. NPDC057682]|uniref:SgcJ/EcaC family oxidoreductase n=1 Tax=unclassified Streptomyces TaxID=2593676 RepID=UPI003661C0E5
MTVNRAHDEAAVRAVLEGVYRAWAAGDAEAFVADYREDATAILPGSYRRSREEARATMAAGFASVLKGSTTVDRLDSIRFLGGGGAVVVSETAVLFPGETEVPEGRSVYATWVLEKGDGAWRIVAYHNSPVVTPTSA